MKKLAFPDSLVLIFAMIVLAQVATYFLPAGEYDRAPRAQAAAASEVVTIPEGTSVSSAAGRTLPLPEDRQIVLPAGTQRMVPGRQVLDGTFHPVEADPLPWHAFLTKIPIGMEKAADIIFFVLIVGGVIAVIRRTGAIDALIGTAIKRLGSSPILLTGGMMTLFAVGASTVGMAGSSRVCCPSMMAMSSRNVSTERSDITCSPSGVIDEAG